LDFNFFIFVKNNTNFVFLCKRFQFLWFCWNKKTCFFHVLFLISIFVFSWKYITIEFFQCTWFHVFLFCENQYNFFFPWSRFKFLGLEKTIRDFIFPCIIPQFDYVFVFVEIYNNGVISTYFTSFLEIYERKYKFGFFHVKDFNFFGLAKKTKLVIFSCITLQFDFRVFVKINKNGVFSMYYTSFFVVL
jgi:hypothetical protein